jgi:hypothetical protein
MIDFGLSGKSLEFIAKHLLFDPPIRAAHSGKWGILYERILITVSVS